MSSWRLGLFLVFSWAMLGCGRPSAKLQPSEARSVATLADEEPILNLAVWADYIAPDVIPNFERETGIQVHVATFDSDPILETQLLVGHSGYDVVIPTGPYFQRQLNAGVYRKLDKSALTNYGNLDPEILKRLAEYDPGNDYAVPYLHTTVGIAYNVNKLRARLGNNVPNSWSLLFDPIVADKLSDCGIVFVDSPIQIFSAAIQYLGKDPRLLNEANVLAASAILRSVRPFLRYIDSAKAIGDLASGNVCIALTWAGDAVNARERAKEAGHGVNVTYIIPREGGQMSIDAVGIPIDAPHPRNALRWLNFLMRPDVIAEVSNYLKYANGNSASMPLVNDAIKEDNDIYPNALTRSRMINAISPSPQYSLLVNREWSRFRSGR